MKKKKEIRKRLDKREIKEERRKKSQNPINFYQLFIYYYQTFEDFVTTS